MNEIRKQKSIYGLDDAFKIIPFISGYHSLSKGDFDHAEYSGHLIYLMMIATIFRIGRFHLPLFRVIVRYM